MADNLVMTRPVAIIEPMKGHRRIRSARGRTSRSNETSPYLATTRVDQRRPSSSFAVASALDRGKRSSVSASLTSQESSGPYPRTRSRSSRVGRSAYEEDSSCEDECNRVRSVLASVRETPLPTALHRSILPPKDQKMLDLMVQKRKADASQQRKSEHFRQIWEKERLDREQMEKEQKAEYDQYLATRREAEVEQAKLRKSRALVEDISKQKFLLRKLKRKQEASSDALKKAEDVQDIESWKKVEVERMRAEGAALQTLLQQAKDEARRDATRAALCARLEDADQNRSAMRKLTLQKKIHVKQIYNTIHRNNLELCKIADYHYAKALQAQIKQKEERMNKLQEEKRKRLNMQRAIAQASAMLREQVRKLSIW